MKIKCLLMALVFGAAANAATVTVTAGFGAQGLNVTSNGVAATNFNVAVGNFTGGIFTQFGTTVLDTGKVNAVITATGPSSLNNLAVHLWVGNGPVGSAESFVILTTNTTTFFPPDVSAAGGPTFNAALGSNLSLVTSSNASFTGGTSTINFTPIPEPSTALLGLLGIAGLIRRRR